MRFERCLRGPVRKRKVEPSGTIFQELVDTISIARKSFPSTLYPAGPQMLLIVSGAFFARSRKRDRKSTRLNSSHMSISYAVFCLKKKKKYNKKILFIRS